MKSGFLSIELENLNNCLKELGWKKEKERMEKRKERGKEMWRNEEGRKENSLSKCRLYFSRATYLF